MDNFDFEEATQTNQHQETKTSDIPDETLANAEKQAEEKLDQAENKALDTADKPFKHELQTLKEETERKILDEQYGFEKLFSGTVLGEQLLSSPENKENLNKIQTAIDEYVSKEIGDVAGPTMSKVIATHMIHTLLELCQTPDDVTKLVDSMKQFGGGSFIQETLKTTQKQIKDGFNDVISLFGGTPKTVVEKNPFGRFEQLFDLINKNKQYLVGSDGTHLLEQSTVLADPSSFRIFLESDTFAKVISGENLEEGKTPETGIHTLFDIKDASQIDPTNIQEAFAALGNKDVFKNINPQQLSEALRNLAQAKEKAGQEKETILKQGAGLFGQLDGLIKMMGPTLGWTSSNAYEMLTDKDSTLGLILNTVMKFLGFSGGIDNLASSYYEAKRQSEYPKQALQASNIIQAYATNYDIDVSQADSIASTRKVSHPEDFYSDMPHSEKGLSSAILAAKQELITGGMSVGFLQALAKSSSLSAAERTKVSECISVDAKTKQLSIKPEKLTEHFDLIAAVTPGFVFDSIKTDMTAWKDKAQLPAIIAEMMTSPRDAKDLATYLKTRSGPSVEDQKVQEGLKTTLTKVNPPSYTPQGADVQEEQKTDDGKEGKEEKEEGGKEEDGKQADDGKEGEETENTESIDWEQSDWEINESTIQWARANPFRSFNETLLRDGKFINKLSSISKDLQIDPNLILRVMYGESGMNPKAKNPTGGDLGLIQFHQSSGLREKIVANTDPVAQLDVIKEFYTGLNNIVGKGNVKNLETLYLYNATPARVTSDARLNVQRAWSQWNITKEVLSYARKYKRLEQKQQKESKEVEGNPEILAKNESEFMGIGDSTLGENNINPKIFAGKLDSQFKNNTKFEKFEGYPGLTTRELLEKIKTQPLQGMKSCLIRTGTNDITKGDSENTLAYLKEICAYLKANNVQPVLSTIVHHQEQSKRSDAYYQKVAVLNSQIQDLAKKESYPLVDFAAKDKLSPFSLRDGIHYDATGLEQQKNLIYENMNIKESSSNAQSGITTIWKGVQQLFNGNNTN